MAPMAVSNGSRPASATKILGLVAGEGKLPAILAQSAKERGYKVVTLALSEDAQVRVSPHSDVLHCVSPGQIGRNIKLMKSEGAQDVVFIGRIPKINLLQNLFKVDWLGIRELSKLPNFHDDTIQRAAGDLLAEHGLNVITQREFLQHLFPDFGVMTEKTPSAAEYADIEFGRNHIKELARLDIGQTIIVKDRIIVAVEAVEGTDQAIRRGVGLAKGPVVVVKVAKQDADPRFDTPTVGMNTLEAMVAPKPGGVLAIAKNETMMVDKEAMIDFANKNDISIVVI